MSRRILTILAIAMLSLFIGGCYTERHEPEHYTVDTFHMTEEVKTPDMTIKRPKKKDWTNLWGLF